MKKNKVKQLVNKIGKVALVSSFLSFGVANSAQAVLTTGISSFTGGLASSSSATRGFRFQATQDLAVTALGVYDVRGDGLVLTSGRSGVDVGLWDDTGNLLGQVLVSGDTTAPILNGFRYANLSTSIDLTANSFYRVGADLSDLDNNSPDFVGRATPNTVNGINPDQSYAVGGFNFPNLIQDSPGQVQLGGNILFGDEISTSVPFEFSPALGLLAVGSFWGLSRLCKKALANKNIKL